MKKIPSLFQRNYDGDKLVRDEVVQGSEWVIAVEGVATRKWDGTSVLVRGGKMFKRYDAKRGKTPPEGWEPCEEKANEQTGHWPGWVQCSRDNPADWMHWEAWDDLDEELPDGTYELIGPRIGKNPEREAVYRFERHGVDRLLDAPRTFDALKDYLASANIEGIVWHHADGRMVKIKARDFGIKRGSK